MFSKCISFIGSDCAPLNPAQGRRNFITGSSNILTSDILNDRIILNPSIREGAYDHGNVPSKYQVVIPQEIREQLNTKVRQRFQIFYYGDRIEFISPKNIRGMKGFLKGIDTKILREKEPPCTAETAASR
jgi:bifunctional DNA-binding transcriptional regulator/antitoxin component of YhaV-PrlF toxin-antitoxin module